MQETDTLVTPIALVMNGFLNVLETKIPEVNFVYDEGLDVTTAIQKIREKNQREGITDYSVSPLFAFRRSVLRYPESGAGRRSVVFDAKSEIVDDKVTLYHTMHGEFDLEFTFYNQNMSGQEFFYRSHETGQPSWSTSFISFSTGHPTVTLSIPFNRGILVGYLNLAALEGIIAKVKVSSHGYACVTDRDGTVIAYPEQMKVSQRLNIRDFEFVWQGLNDREGTFRGRLEGIDTLSSVVIVPQTHWLVAVNQPIVDAYMPVRRIRNILLIGSSAAIILAIGIALVR